MGSDWPSQSEAWPAKRLTKIEVVEYDETRHGPKTSSSESTISNEKPVDNVDNTVYPTGFRLVSILLALILSIFLVALDMTIVATAIPKITADFNSLNDIGWYGSSFLLTLASFQSTWGKVYKYFPMKLSYVVAIGLFETGSFICAIAPNSVLLIIGRAVAGLGGAGIASGAYTIIALSAPPNRRPAYTGILGAVYAIASVIGPPLGGMFTDKMTWRWCFWINLPIGLVSVIIIFLFFRAPVGVEVQRVSNREKILQMDLPGTAVLMGAITCIILGLQWGGVTKKWVSAEVLATLIGGVVLLVIFVALEIWQGDRAAIEPRLMKQKTIALLSTFQVFNSGLFLMFLYYLPLYFQVVDGVSASESGIRNLPYVLGVAVFTMMSGGGVTLTGRYIPFLVVGAIATTAGAALVYTLDLHAPSSQWIGYQILAGTVGLTVQIPVIVGQAIVEPEDVSSITAIMVFFQTLAGAVSVSVGQSVFANILLKSTVENVPGINPAIVLGVGATALRQTFPPIVLDGIIKSYMQALQSTYFIGIILGGLSCLLAYCIALFDMRRLTMIMGMHIG